MKRSLSIAIVIFTLGAQFAAACSCGGRSPVEEELAESQAVFIGRVVEIERKTPVVVELVRTLLGKVRSAFGGREYDPFESGGYGRVITFDVIRPFKGVSNGEAEVTTGFGGGDCGIPFRVGETYLVYAYADYDDLGTGICTRTAHISRSQDDIRALSAKPAA